MSPSPKRLLIFVVAYNAENTIKSVFSRIPHSIKNNFYVEILAIDDASSDKTFYAANSAVQILDLPFKTTILKNPINQGYGGNQKIGYHFAIKYGFDYVALIHGDGQYAPECLPELLDAFSDKNVGAVFGSRMLKNGGAISGGMPLYKFIGNKILTKIENFLLRSNLSEFHSGYRIYSIEALKKIPFELNSHDFHFDTEIIVQLFARKIKILELPIPTYYGDEICHVNGIKYAKDVILTVLQYRAQELSLFYDARFDCNAPLANYEIKLGAKSTHTLALDAIPKQSTILDIGCASGYLGSVLKSTKQCNVVGVDKHQSVEQFQLDDFISHDLLKGPPSLDYSKFNYCLLLDVIEHLPNPETFLKELRAYLDSSPNITLIASTGNIAFVITRIMLLFGYFNYGKRGILDITHTRLFTFSSFRRLFIQAGFTIKKIEGIPAPFGLAINSKILSKILNLINELLIKIMPRLFSYQIFVIAQPNPSLETLLNNAISNKP